MGKAKEEAGGEKIIAQNRKARFEYHISDTMEAGVVLSGAEIKSIRNNGISIEESYVRPQAGEVFLLGAHIKPYSHSGDKEYDPVRPRKLLLHAHEIQKLLSRVEAKGFTIVPLKVYLKHGRAKVEIGIAKGKNAPDKRTSIKEKESKREMDRARKAAR